MSTFLSGNWQIQNFKHALQTVPSGVTKDYPAQSAQCDGQHLVPQFSQKNAIKLPDSLCELSIPSCWLPAAAQKISETIEVSIR